MTRPPPTGTGGPTGAAGSDLAPRGSGARGGWRRWARRIYAIALAATVVAVVVSERGRIADLLDGTRPGPLAAALALGWVSLVQAAWFWARALTRLGAPRRLGEVLEATVASIPARYVPGSVWYAAGRIGHLRASGSPSVALGLVALLETLLSFLVAVALGIALLAASGAGGEGLSVVVLVVSAAALGVAASPWVLNPIVRRLARRRRIQHVPVLGWALELELCAHLVVFWLSSAAGFVLYLHAFPAIDPGEVVDAAATFLLAWAAGFLAVFAPQGAGVFETAVAGTLDGAPLAALAVVVAGYRGLVLVRDVVALAALALRRLVSARRIEPAG